MQIVLDQTNDNGKALSMHTFMHAQLNELNLEGRRYKYA